MLVDKAMCPLPEVAGLVHKNAASIVEEAYYTEGIQLYVKVPSELQVFSVHATHRARSAPFFAKSIVALPHPAFPQLGLEFLALRKDDLRGLYNKGIERVDTFEAGVYFDKQGIAYHFCASELEVVYDAWTVEQLTLPMRTYALYPFEFELRADNSDRLRFPRPIEATWENIYVKRTDIPRFLPLPSKRHSEMIGRIQLHHGPHISDDLQSLRQLLLTEFQLALSANNQVPSSEALISKLTDQFDFSANRADAGAQVLLSSLTTMLREESPDDNEFPAILYLFDYAQKLWGNDPDPSAPQLPVKKVAPLLAEQIKLSGSAAKACVALMRPSGQTGRLRAVLSE